MLHRKTAVRVGVALGVLCVIGGIAGARSFLAPTPPETAAYFLLTDNPSVTDIRLQRQAILAERLTAECMHAAGLPYTEHLPQPPTDPDAELSPYDWAAKFGFGVTTRLDMPMEAEADPNLALMEGLSTSERADYAEVLLGVDDSDRGCRGRVEDTVGRPRQEAIDGVHNLLVELSQRSAAHPKIRDAEADWYTCAAAAGFPVDRKAGRNVVAELFAARLSLLLDTTGQVVDTERLSQLQNEERSAAVALVECDTKYVASTDPAVREITRAWVLEHQQALDGLRARLTGIDEKLRLMIEEPSPPVRG